MVTDEQYNELKARVAVLENKINQLSRQYSALYMKNDVRQALSEAEPPVIKKDKTRYAFNGKVLCKRQLVLECITSFVSDHSNIKAKDLRDFFPDYIQGSLGVIKQVDEAAVYKNAHRRFFLSDEHILHLSDGDYAICSQWDKSNIVRFINAAREQGLDIEVIERKY